MRILGISAYQNDSAASLIEDGQIIAAAQEERFTRIKNDNSFPHKTIAACLTQSGCTFDDLDMIAFSGDEMQRDRLNKELPTAHNKLVFVSPEESYLAAAFYPSPFKESCILSVGEIGTSNARVMAVGCDNKISVISKEENPNSLALLYSNFTSYLGFKPMSGEYKVMGLAPYGSPKYTKDILDNFIDLKADGSFILNEQNLSELFGQKERAPETKLTDFHMDIAASIQSITNEVMLRTTRFAAKETGQKNLCLTGAIALNCVANGKVHQEGLFEKIWIQPAAGHAGCALGAALSAYYDKNKRTVSNKDCMQGTLLGPNFTQEEIERTLTKAEADYEIIDTDSLVKKVARDLDEGKVVGWMQGRMEFGPRALGNRSILADPRSAKMQKILNLKIKNRESFRPFAPSVLREDLADWFALDQDSPYMLFVTDICDKRKLKNSGNGSAAGLEKLHTIGSQIPAVTHVDYSSRIQTVDKDRNPLYHALISEFKSCTGCPILVNTSFNVRGEPIVYSPDDAYRCFLATDMDILVIGNCYIKKKTSNNSIDLDTC